MISLIKSKILELQRCEGFKKEIKTCEITTTH